MFDGIAQQILKNPISYNFFFFFFEQRKLSIEQLITFQEEKFLGTERVPIDMVPGSAFGSSKNRSDGPDAKVPNRKKNKIKNKKRINWSEPSIARIGRLWLILVIQKFLSQEAWSLQIRENSGWELLN